VTSSRLSVYCAAVSGPQRSLRPALVWAGPLALVLGLAALACGGADIAAVNPDDVASRSERQDYEDANDDEERSTWRWQGRRQDCFFIYDNECFSYLDEACQAAGCDDSSCAHDDSAPAKVSCPEAD
jgi:hypothetical protein